MLECIVKKFDDMTKMANIVIYYDFHETPFGRCLIGVQRDQDRELAVCHLSYADADVEKSLENELTSLKYRYPGAQFIREYNETKHLIKTIFNEKAPGVVSRVNVLLKGTDFQIKVWEALTRIPVGEITTYQSIAESINHPKAARAVGSALKSNNIGYLIPCHRVACKNGCNKFSWRAEIKEKMQDYERKLIN